MDIVFANTTAIVSHPVLGSSVGVVHGTHWPAEDPVVLAYPDFFTADPRYGLSSSVPIADDGYPVGTAPAIEQATAVPGEKRSRGRSRAEADEK